ncbi:hypothetical protein ABXV18_26945 [Vibrio owensii]|uniref:hypothetical protein n=1 Tax=Vibrio owensii TaxID=696485 RepID=UPI003390ACF7
MNHKLLEKDGRFKTTANTSQYKALIKQGWKETTDIANRGGLHRLANWSEVNPDYKKRNR